MTADPVVDDNWLKCSMEHAAELGPSVVESADGRMDEARLFEESKLSM